MARTDAYGNTVNRPSGLTRMATILNRWLHFVSVSIVLGIAAYFIAQYTDNTHLVFWLTIACIDAALTLPALALPVFDFYKSYLFPVHWIFSYLWLTAFIFSSQDYNFNNTCARSPAGVNKCSIKLALESFAFIAFFTNVVGQLLEGSLGSVISSRRFGAAYHAGGGTEKDAENAEPGAAA